MDAELEALMKQLSDVQKQPSKVQVASTGGTGRGLINERNAVDLVLKLVDAGYISIIFTNDGRSYVTPERLREEIKGEVASSGGRVNVVSLATTLSVDQTVVDENVDAIVGTGGGNGYHLVGNDLISDGYIRAVRAEVSDALSSSARGALHIPELSARFSLPETFIVETVLVGCEGCRVSTEEGLVYTNAYTRWLKARVCGALNSVTQPTRLPELAQRCSISESMFVPLATEAVKAGRVLGEVDAVKRLFTPEVYLKATRQWITAFYTQNGFVRLKTFSDLKYGRSPEEAVVALLGSMNPVLLDTVAVAPWKLDVAAAMINEAVADEGTFVDTADVFPPSFGPGDVRAALTHCVEGLSKAAFVVDCGDGSQLIISKKFASEALEYASKRVDINSNGNSPILNAYRNYRCNDSASSADDDGNSGGGDDNSDSDDEDSVKRPKKASRKKGGKKQPQKKKCGSTTNASEMSPKEVFAKEVEALVAEFVKSRECDDNEEYVRAIAGIVSQDVEKACAECVEKEKVARLEESRSKSRELRSGLLALFVDALLAASAIDTLELKESDKQAIKKHVQHTVYGDLVLGIAKAQAASLGVQVPAPKQGQDSFQQAAGIMPLFAGQAALQRLPRLAVADSDDAQDEFFDICAAALRGLGVREKLFDKARQHERLLQHEVAYAKALDPETRPPAVLHTAVSLLFVRIFQCYLPFPPKFIHVFLDMVKAFVGEAAFATLVEFQKNVVLFIKAGGKAGQCPDVDQYLSTNTPEIKAIATGKVTVCQKKDVSQKESHKQQQQHHQGRSHQPEEEDEEGNSAAKKDRKGAAQRAGKKERHRF